MLHGMSKPAKKTDKPTKKPEPKPEPRSDRQAPPAAAPRPKATRREVMTRAPGVLSAQAEKVRAYFERIPGPEAQAACKFFMIAIDNLRAAGGAISHIPKDAPLPKIAAGSLVRLGKENLKGATLLPEEAQQGTWQVARCDDKRAFLRLLSSHGPLSEGPYTLETSLRGLIWAGSATLPEDRTLQTHVVNNMPAFAGAAPDPNTRSGLDHLTNTTLGARDPDDLPV